MCGQSGKIARSLLRRSRLFSRRLDRRKIDAARSEAVAQYSLFLKSRRRIFWLKEASSGKEMQYLSSFHDDGVDGRADLVARNEGANTVTRVLVRTRWHGSSPDIDDLRMERDAVARELRSVMSGRTLFPLDPKWAVEQVEVDGQLIEFEVTRGARFLVMAGRPAPSCVIALYVEGEDREIVLSALTARTAFSSPAEMFG